MEKIEYWRCTHCHTLHPTITECKECEERCEKEKKYKYISFFNKKFPSNHPKDMGSIKHCVDCGTLVSGHKPFMNGARCSDCIQEVKRKLGELLMKAEDEKDNSD